MLYLEDYLEMIEHLPQELKDRFTEIRELDLQVQNASDRLDDRVRLLFQTAKKNRALATPDNPEFDSIRKEYYKALEDADEKVHQATQMYDLVDRYLRRLDQELHKFKMELEADNAGITEVLEKRSLELDTPLSRDRERDRDQSQKENRFSLSNVILKSEKKSERKSSVEKGLHSGHASGTSTPTLSYSLGHVGSAGVGSSGSGAGAAAIAAAASQAIAATQQMQQGRRTASLKASYDAINLGMNPQEFSIGKELLINPELQQAAQQAMLSTLAATAGSSSGQEQKRNKRKSQHTHSNSSELLPPSAVEEIVDSNILDSVMAESDWVYDVNEPRYCTCNQVSYGDMVACDNPDCPIEWFHYGCVNLDMAPKGKWYCPECSAAMRRRGRR